MNSYEKNLSELKKITAAFSEESLSLEESVALFERGVKLADAAVGELKKTYGRMMELKEEMDGVFALSFDGGRNNG